MMLPLNNSMQVKVITKNPIGKIVSVDLNSNSTEQPTQFNLENSWHKLIIPTTRANIIDITIGDESIKHILNAGAQVEEQYHIWIHGDLSVLMERVFNCINQDDLLRWTKLNRKYLFTESWNHTAPNFVPTHIKNFFAKKPLYHHLYVKIDEILLLSFLILLCNNETNGIKIFFN